MAGMMEGHGNTLSPLVKGSVVTIVAAILLPLLAALGTRVKGAKLVTAWRGNLRRMLPVTAAVCALVFLASGLIAAQERSTWLANWKQGKLGSFAMMKRNLGAAWTNPTVPPGAWHAEYPPNTSGY